MGLSLKYVLLGMVVERPGYGYDLMRRMEERLPSMEFTAGSVYPALDRLEEKLLIEAKGPKERGSTTRGSPRLMYAATPLGVERFDAWMVTPTSPEKSRDGLLAKLPLARPQDVPRLIEMARRQEAQLRRQLGRLTEAPAPEWSGRGPVPLPLIGSALVRSAEAKRLSAAIESLQEVWEALEHYQAGSPSPRSTGFQPPRR